MNLVNSACVGSAGILTGVGACFVKCCSKKMKKEVINKITTQIGH